MRTSGAGVTRVKQYRYALEADIDVAPPTPADLRREMEASDIEEAAEAAAENGDRESGESPSEQSVWILDPDTEQIVECIVYMELEPTYRATRY
jgi:hypothetical protein